MEDTSTSSLSTLHQRDHQHPPINKEALSEYTRYNISELKPGPVNATFTGILVNLQENSITDGTPQLATKAYTLVLRDQTGEITVHLWVATREYQLLLNQRITIWTTHVCAATAVRAFTSGKCIVTTPNSTHVFPEQNPRCRLTIEPNFGARKLRLESGVESSMTLEQVTKEKEEKEADCTLLVKVIAVGKPVETNTGLAK
ncbi:hypothetical protein LTR84_003533 [Exophiala bonariae]|uniref:OB domain-containing protein n=1 Tax=Exophiala bonariae TaxID=1690606 RepID=A0AAV9N7J6_9EURO|nr:hypothetical protein LTR84_003533 [Exophiala bonariae]